MAKGISYREIFWSHAPEYWKNIKLGDILKRINLKFKDYKDDNIEVLSVTNDKGFVKPEEKFDKKVASDNLDNYKVVKKGQFAYNPARINVGSIAFLESFEKGLISPMYEVFEVNDDSINPKFIKYFAKSYKAISLYDAFSQGSVRQTLKFDLMCDIPYVLPPIEEQQKIAEILSEIDKLIAKVELSLEKYKKLKKGLMQELLTKGIGHSEFKEVRIGPKKVEIPVKWNIKELRNISDLITKGTTPTSYGFDYIDEGINFIKVENLNESGVIDSSFVSKISEEADEKLSRSKLKENDILCSIAGTLGRCALVKKDILPANTNQALSIIRMKNKKCDNKYILYYLQSRHIQKYIKAISTVSAQPNLSLKQIGEFLVLLPPLEEQKKIANILSSVDEKIQKKQEEKEKVEKLKKGLMQKLLTGQIRVNA